MHSDSYIDLDRVFREEAESEDDLFKAEIRTTINEISIQWPDLLQQPYVVVLGEHGSGKTEEFRARERQLKSQGKPVLRIELKDLVGGARPEDIVDPDDIQNFRDRLTDKIPGFLFLDGLDELRLSGGRLKRLKPSLNVAVQFPGSGLSPSGQAWETERQETERTLADVVE